MRFAITGNTEKQGLGEAVLRLARLLRASGVDFVLDRRLRESPGLIESSLLNDTWRPMEECVRDGELIIAFGGDGTILSTARDVGERGIPILGVNLGKLGFLAESSPEDMQAVITDILANKYSVEERLVLEATTPALPGRVIRALNDIVIDKSRSSRLIDVQMSIDDAFAVTYRGDGLIISTPTGSTGYALSSGGPIVTPTCAVIGITPIAPHTLNGRPLIIPAACEISIHVDAPTDEVLISADGQMEGLVRPPVEMHIARAGYPLRLVRRMDRTYFDVLRAKLFWGQDARSV